MKLLHTGNRPQANVKDLILEYSIVILCLLLLFVPATFSSTYLNAASLTALSKDIAIWGTMAIGVSFVMLTGNNDLSIGLSVSMLTVFTVLLANRFGAVIAIPAVLVIGILAGALNGLLVGVLGLNPYIATLGTQLLFEGIGLVVSGGSPIYNYNASIAAFYDMVILDLGILKLTLPFLVSMLLLAAASWFLKYTNFGQNIYVVGGNREAAALCGISTRKVTIVCYAISGFCAAVTAIFVTSLNSCGNGAVGLRFSLQTVAACVLGGISMSGGYGSAARAILGVCAMQLIQKTLYQIDASLANLQVGIIGIVLLVFMLINNATQSNAK